MCLLFSWLWTCFMGFVYNFSINFKSTMLKINVSVVIYQKCYNLKRRRIVNDVITKLLASQIAVCVVEFKDVWIKHKDTQCYAKWNRWIEELTVARLIAGNLTFFHHQMAVNSTEWNQIIVTFGILVIDSESNITTLRDKLPTIFTKIK